MPRRYDMKLTRSPILLLALLVVALVCAPQASASPFMASVVQDDNLLVYGNGLQRERALDRMKTMGVDAVRVTVLWQAIGTRRKPRNGANPKSYPAFHWDRVDDLVKSATRRGILVYLSVTGPGPKWAHAKSPDPANRATWKPNAREFGRFVQAVGTRYSGTYTDENAARQPLPRVGWWGVFNEANQGGWLTPQAQRKRGVSGVIPQSPALYRDLLVEGSRGLIKSGHADDLILMGETAPLGVKPESERRPLRPALFLRELFCLDNRLRRFKGRQAAARNCKTVKRLSVLEQLPRLAFGHHPYTKDLPPNKRPKHRDEISIANIATLPKLLDRIAKRTKLIPDGLPVLLTEFGYETNPPDVINGIPLDKHAEYLNVGDYLAYKNPRVFANTQFQLYDVPPRKEFPRNSRPYWFTYQSGLFMADGTPKPAAFAYVMPFHVIGRSKLWGQVRFTPNGTEQTVYLQFKAAGSSTWQDGGNVKVTNSSGFWELSKPLPSGSTWRAVWAAPDFSTTSSSREIKVR